MTPKKRRHAVSDDVTLHIELRDNTPPRWLITSEGFAAQGHPEVVLLLDAAADEAQPPEEALGIFEHMQLEASRGRWLSVGDVVDFGGSILGDHVAFTLISPRLPSGLEVERDTLQMVLLKGAESELLKGCGEARFLACWSAARAVWPGVLWSSREREPLDVDGMAEQSLMALLPRLRLPEASTMLADGALTLRLPRSARAHFARGLDVAGAVALLTDHDTSADACLVWKPGEPGSHLSVDAGTANARLTGSFVAIIGNQESNGARLHEDGFVLMCRQDTWERILKALAEGDDLDVEGESQLMPLHIRWEEDRPAPIVVPLAEGASWISAWLDGDAPSADAPDLLAWLTALGQRSDRHLAQHIDEHSGFALLLNIDVHADGVRVRCATEPEYMPFAWLDGLATELASAPAPKGQYHVQLALDIEGRLDAGDVPDMDFG